MRLFHAPGKTHAAFDDEHVIGLAGLLPAMRLAERCRLADLVDQCVAIGDRDGVNAPIKVSAIVAGMLAGADSIDDLDVLRHGGMDKLFADVRAPSTLGAFLRSFTWGNVRQLEKAGRMLLGRLAAHTPLLPDAGVVAFVDVDSMQRRTYGYAKQGSGFGHTKIGGKNVLVRGLNVLLATLSTPTAAPVILAGRLRGGSASSSRGAGPFLRESIGAARTVGARRIVVVRADSAFYSAGAIAACRDNDAYFSVTAKMDPKIKQAIAAIPESAWIPIAYPRAVFDEQAGGWVSDAQVAETRYTAFASTKGRAVTARLIVRRIKRLNEQAANGQDEFFATWRYHPIFTDSPFDLVQAEAQHRDHAINKQVNSDLIDGPLAHLPSGIFTANAAWLTLAVIAYNLLRATGCLASAFHAKARGATLRRQLINVPARIARSGRGHLTMHLPGHWRWQGAWMNLFEATHQPHPQ
ncbi:MAG: IS1380 family transposase [Microbispora sp.]|nr:IS1380 family transposase [Microbispora sp.]